MKINIGNPTTGCNKTYEIDDPHKLRIFMDRRLAHEIDISSLGDDFKGYIVKITGGSDKDGFPMMQGVLINHRTRLLLNGSMGCFNPARKGERKRRTIRGCIIANDIGALNCIIVRKGEKELAGLTDKVVPRRLGPKRASKIRKLFNLSKDEDVRKHAKIFRRTVMKKDGTKRGTKGCKIQRLITPERLNRKRRILAAKRERWVKSKRAAVEYAQAILERTQKRRLASKEATKQIHLAQQKKNIEKANQLKAARIARVRSQKRREARVERREKLMERKRKLHLKKKLQAKQAAKAASEKPATPAAPVKAAVTKKAVEKVVPKKSAASAAPVKRPSKTASEPKKAKL